MSIPNPRRSISLRRLKTGVIAIATALPLTILGIPAASAASNSHEMAPNEHTHVNWLFTKAGNYQATFAITVPYRDSAGKTATVQTEGTLNFSAGTDGQGTVTTGHYDFGPQVDTQNQVGAMLKNPSGKPEDPADLWFGLTDKAHRDLSSETCTSLGLGTKCGGWMIPQNQEAGIPWVGFNTQDAKLHSIMSGAATFTLTSLTGSGDMYVWQDGSFGGVNGTWFAVGGDGSGAFDEEEPEAENQDQEEKGAKPPAGAKTPREKENEAKTPGGAKKPAHAPKKPHSPESNPSKTTVPDSAADKKDANTSPNSSPANSSQAATFRNATANAAGAAPASEPCYPIPSSQKFSLPRQTHVHPNWVFTQPGNYQVGIRQSARINGQLQSADTILNFNVGGTGSANEGHFDLGAKVENGLLVATLKDDRTAGGTWVNPRSLTFGLGAGAQAKLPAGLEFLAPAGTPVWMIGSTQTSGVPWLGANTQHPSLVEATNEPVTWELLSFHGPVGGRLAVFTSGNFGKVVGQKWFTAPTSATNVGRTASGKLCHLDGSVTAGTHTPTAGGLAATGVGDLLLPLAVFAGGIILLGFALIRRAREEI